MPQEQLKPLDVLLENVPEQWQERVIHHECSRVLGPDYEKNLSVMFEEDDFLLKALSSGEGSLEILKSQYKVLCILYDPNKWKESRIPPPGEKPGGQFEVC